MTEKDTELSRSLVVGRKRDGRCCYDKEAKRELIEACLQPGVSVARMALQHGINANLLRTWITRSQREGQASVALQPSGKNVLSTTSPFVPVVQVKASAKTSPLSLGAEMPNGVKLDLSNFGLDDLSLILKLLCRLPCSGSMQG